MIQSDYIFLDLPYYGNVGDVMIWQSTLDILRYIPQKCLYSSSVHTYQKPSINENVTIIFMGGGNFGDLWESHQLFRHNVMKDFPNNPIVQLPQSVCWQSEDKKRTDIEKFKRHKGKVFICLRDTQSYDLINREYDNVTPILLPDMVLGLDVDFYLKKWHIDIRQPKGCLYVRRNDSEVGYQNKSDGFVPENAVIADWPSMSKKYKPMRCYTKISHYIRILLGSSTQHRLLDYIFKFYIKDCILKSGFKFIASYQTVYTTRLHAGILAYLMGKEVMMFDNSYGKISGVYDLWLSNKISVKMI